MTPDHFTDNLGQKWCRLKEGDILQGDDIWFTGMEVYHGYHVKEMDFVRWYLSMPPGWELRRYSPRVKNAYRLDLSQEIPPPHRRIVV